MPVLKEYRFSATADGVAGEKILVHAPGKPAINVAKPPEFGGHDASRWSPEELLLAACASCYELTLAAVAHRRAIPLRFVEIRTAGHVTLRPDGHLGFVAIELDVELVTDADRLEEAEAAARQTKNVCIVSTALDVPLRVHVHARARDQELMEVGVR